MYYRKLGNTGCLVGEIGFGAWSLAAPPPDDDTAVALLRFAIERGANFIDMAPMYGDGRSERLVGRAIEGRREQALIATKGGLVNRDGTLERDFSPAQIERSAQESLERLRCEYIDLYQLHCPTTENLRDPRLWETLDRLKGDGLIRHLGIVAGELDVALVALDEGRVETVQIVLNALDSSMLPVLPRARAAGVGVIVRGPLLAGVLTGEPGRRDDVHAPLPGDPRQEQRSVLQDVTPELLERFARLTQDSGRTPAQTALGWVLGHEEVSVTIPSARTIAQLEENLAASDLPLPSARQMAAIQHLQLTSAVP